MYYQISLPSLCSNSSHFARICSNIPTRYFGLDAPDIADKTLELEDTLQPGSAYLETDTMFCGSFRSIPWKKGMSHESKWIIDTE